MNVVALRKELGLSQEAFAQRVGLSSKGHVSDIERTGSCGVETALKIEEISGGRISASSLNAKIALVQASSAQQAA